MSLTLHYVPDTSANRTKTRQHIKELISFRSLSSPRWPQGTLLKTILPGLLLGFALSADARTN